MVLTAGSWRDSAASLWLSARFWLLERHRHRALVLERVRGIPILVLDDVFNPALFGSSELLLRALPPLVRPGMRVLDVGTGSGLLAVGAARLGAQVVAVDLLPAAVRCASINALLNGVDDRVEVHQSDLFASAVGEQFDLVLFNPPYFHGRPRAAWETAWRSPMPSSASPPGFTRCYVQVAARYWCSRHALPIWRRCWRTLRSRSTSCSGSGTAAKS